MTDGRVAGRLKMAFFFLEKNPKYLTFLVRSFLKKIQKQVNHQMRKETT